VPFHPREQTGTDSPFDPQAGPDPHFGGIGLVDVLVDQQALQPGQRQTAVHLPIHPVLPHTPHVECEPLDDSSVHVQVTSSHAYGVRLEVNRTAGIAAEAAVPIGLLLTTSDSGVSAA